jgi:hypothetical protein
MVSAQAAGATSTAANVTKARFLIFFSKNPLSPRMRKIGLLFTFFFAPQYSADP